MKQNRCLTVLASCAIALIFFATVAFAHCDTMDGPVVKAAQQALETGNVDLVLIWVQKHDEAVIREAFNKTLAMRKLSAEAKNFADMYFFETLVRIHRAGEGAPYNGLKPAGTEVESGIQGADEAIKLGSVDSLLHELSATIRHGVLRRFDEVRARSNYKQNDLEAGREYVRAYVEFIHYVEFVRQTAGRSGDHQLHDIQHD